MTTPASAPAASPSLSRLLATAGGMLVSLSLVTGIAYPLAITGLARLAFHHRATGSFIVEEGQVHGSELVGQPFVSPRYFWSRPSVTTAMAYNAGASGGSNLGPTNEALTKAVKERIDALRAADPENTTPVPIDLVTASGSGLDPHITPAAADYQVRRVARARGLGEARVRELVTRSTEPRTFGILGEPRVNVLELNRALDREH